MLEALGIFVLLEMLRWWSGSQSEEHKAAEAIANVLQKQGEANANELRNAAAAAAVPSAVPAAAPATAPAPIAPALPVAPAPVILTPQGPASPAVAPAPFPAAAPVGLPSWPEGFTGGAPPAGWKFADQPPGNAAWPAVIKRAVQLLPQLWQTGAGSHVCEMTAGTWTCYNAEIHQGGKHGVTAYQVK